MGLHKNQNQWLNWEIELLVLQLFKESQEKAHELPKDLELVLEVEEDQD